MDKKTKDKLRQKIDKLELIRDKLGMTQGEFAQRVGIKRTRYNQWIHDNSLPDVEGLIKIQDFLEDFS